MVPDRLRRPHRVILVRVLGKPSHDLLEVVDGPPDLARVGAVGVAHDGSFQAAGRFASNAVISSWIASSRARTSASVIAGAPCSGAGGGAGAGSGAGGAGSAAGTRSGWSTRTMLNGPSASNCARF